MSNTFSAPSLLSSTFLQALFYAYLVLLSVTIIHIHNPTIYLLCISITFIIFLAPFILSHLLFFRHATNTPSATPVSPSQRTIFCTRHPPDHFSSLWGSEALLRKVTRGRHLRQKEESPSKILSFWEKKTGLYFPPLNCQTTGNHNLLKCKCILFVPLS